MATEPTFTSGGNVTLVASLLHKSVIHHAVCRTWICRFTTPCFPCAFYHRATYVSLERYQTRRLRPNTPHTTKKQFKSDDPHQGESRPDPESLCRVRSRTLNLDKFQNLTTTYLSKHTSVIKISLRSDQFFQRHEPNWGKYPISQC